MRFHLLERRLAIEMLAACKKPDFELI